MACARFLGLALVPLLAAAAFATDIELHELENPFSSDDTFQPVDLDADGVPDRPGESDLSYFPPAKGSSEGTPAVAASPVTLGVTGPAGRAVELILADAEGRSILTQRGKLDRAGHFRVDRVMTPGRYRLKARLLGAPAGSWRETGFVAGKNLAPTVNLGSL